jgi:cytochrome c biogenesis protein CcmG/thiol:disulfide interchange protein DsbE
MPSDRSARQRRDLLRALGSLGLLGTGAAVSPLPAASLQVGQPAPPAILNTLDGQKLSTTQYAGKVVILTFWATWCVPCREELPLLSAYAQAHAEEGLVVLGFSLDDPDNLAQVRAVSRTLAFPTGLLGGDRLAGYGRIWRVPVNFTIDRQGHLADNGWKDRKPVWTQERLERIVGPLLSTTRTP